MAKPEGAASVERHFSGGQHDEQPRRESSTGSVSEQHEQLFRKHHELLAKENSARASVVGTDGVVAPTPGDSFTNKFAKIQQEMHLTFGTHEMLVKKSESELTHAFAGFFCTYTIGFDGIVKLRDYNLRRMVQFGGISCMFCKGTVFLMDRFVLFMCLQQCAVVVLIAVLGFHWGVSEEDVETYDRLASQTTSLVPMVIGLYISNSLARWWALRETSIGHVFSCLIDVTMLMAAQRPEPEWKSLHIQLAKFGLVSIQLIIRAARRREDIDDLVTDELLTQDEVDYLLQLESFQRPVAVWAWILRMCQFAWTGLPPPEFNPIQLLCVEAKSSIDNIYTYLRTQLPFAYVHLVACLAHIQNLAAALHGGLKISLEFHNTETWIREIGMATVVCLIYQGLLGLSYIIEDPFGDDMLDFPVKSFTAYVMASIRAVQEAQWNSHALDKLKARIAT